MSDETGWRVYFWVAGFESPSEVATILGVKATESWRKGDIFQGGAIRPDSAWTLSVDSGYGPSLEDRLARLVSALEDLAEGIAVTQRRFRTGINVVAYLVEANPGFHLSHDLLARLNRLQISVDFDLYCLNENAGSAAGETDTPE